MQIRRNGGKREDPGPLFFMNIGVGCSGGGGAAAPSERQREAGASTKQEFLINSRVNPSSQIVLISGEGRSMYNIVGSKYSFAEEHFSSPLPDRAASADAGRFLKGHRHEPRRRRFKRKRSGQFAGDLHKREPRLPFLPNGKVNPRVCPRRSAASIVHHFDAATSVSLSLSFGIPSASCTIFGNSIVLEISECLRNCDFISRYSTRENGRSFFK